MYGVTVYILCVWDNSSQVDRFVTQIKRQLEESFAHTNFKDPLITNNQYEGNIYTLLQAHREEITGKEISNLLHEIAYIYIEITKY